MGRDFFSRGGGGNLNIIIMSGGVEINFRLMKWRYDLVLGHILPISQPPPLQIIISQSLITLFIFSIIYSQ